MKTCQSFAHRYRAIEAVDYYKHEIHGGIALCRKCSEKLGYMYKRDGFQYYPNHYSKENAQT